MSETLTVLLLATWTGATAFLVYGNRVEEFLDEVLWIPLLLAIAGVFSSMLPLVLSPAVAIAANATILMLFIASLGALKLRRSSTALTRHRA